MPRFLFGSRGIGETMWPKFVSCGIVLIKSSSAISVNPLPMGSLEDVNEIDAASNNGVDELRDIATTTYAPSSAVLRSGYR